MSSASDSSGASENDGQAGQEDAAGVTSPEAKALVKEQWAKANTDEQLLAVVTLRRWFVRHDGELAYFAGGLSVEEARELGLGTIIGARLSVPKLPIRLHTFAASSTGLDLGAMLTAAWGDRRSTRASYAGHFHGQPKRLRIEASLDQQLPQLRQQLTAAGIEVILATRDRALAASKTQLQREDVGGGYRPKKRNGVLVEYFTDYTLCLQSMAQWAHREEPVRAWRAGSLKGLVLHGAGVPPASSWKGGNTDNDAAEALTSAQKLFRPLLLHVRSHGWNEPLDRQTQGVVEQFAGYLETAFGEELALWRDRFVDTEDKHQLLLVSHGSVGVLVGTVRIQHHHALELQGRPIPKPMPWPMPQQSYWRPFGWAFELSMLEPGLEQWPSVLVELHLNLVGAWAMKKALEGPFGSGMRRAITGGKFVLRGVSPRDGEKRINQKNTLDQLESLLSCSEDDAWRLDFSLGRLFGTGNANVSGVRDAAVALDRVLTLVGDAARTSPGP